MPSTPEGVRGRAAKGAAARPPALWLQLADYFIAASAARSANEPSRPDVLVDRAAVPAMASEGGRDVRVQAAPGPHPARGIVGQGEPSCISVQHGLPAAPEEGATNLDNYIPETANA